MGIERFFSTLSNLETVWQELKYPFKKKKCKILLIDFNSIIHFTSSRVLFNKKMNIEDEILKNVGFYLEHLLTEIIDFKVLDTIYLAIDGVPSFGKLREQLKRRYMGSLIKSSNIWSKNNITPGSKFMKKLNKYLKDYINILYEKYLIKNIIVSDSNEPGEGEIKIINYLRNLSIKDKNTDIIIFSPDSDMVLLNLLIKSNFTVTLLRFNQQKSELTLLNNKTNVYEIMEMKNFRNYLVSHLSNKTQIKLEEKKVIRDLILIFNCFGNDFLPKIMSINLKHDFLKIIDLYGISLIENNDYLINKGNLNWYNLKTILKLTSNFEYENLKLEHNRFIYHNYDKVLYNNFYQDINLLQKFISDIKIDFYKLTKSNTTNKLLLNKFYYFYKKQSLNKIKNLKNEDNQFFYLGLRLVNLEELYTKLYQDKTINYIKLKDNKTLTLIKKYKVLFYHLSDLTNLIDDLISYFYLYDNLPLINKKVFIKNISNDRLVLKKRQFDSSSKFHQNKINDLDLDEIEMYKITNYLDGYYDKLKPYVFKDFPNNQNYVKDYYERFFKKTDNPEKYYLEGINWIFNHYLKGKTDKRWYYPYSHAPLISKLLEKYDTLINIKFKERVNKLKPYQQFIIVTPYNKQNSKLIDYNEEKVNKIYRELINSKLIPKEITLENIDCSGSIFFNKCHPNIIDTINLDKLYKYFLN